MYLGFNWVPSLLNTPGLNPTAGSAGITAFNVGGVIGAIGGALALPRWGSRFTMLTMASGHCRGLPRAGMALAPRLRYAAVLRDHA